MGIVNSTGIRVGSATPWGTADWAAYPMTGVAVVGTPSHGGWFVEPHIARAIPARFRKDNGWYEEDCEALIPAFFLYDQLSSPASSRDEIARHLRRWFPTEFAAEFPVLEARFAREETAQSR